MSDLISFHSHICRWTFWIFRFLLWCCWHLTEEAPCVLFPRCGFSRCPGLERPPVGLPQQLRESWSTQSSQTSGCLSSDRWATHTPTHTHTYTFDAKNSAKSPKMTLSLYTQIKSSRFQILVLQSSVLQGQKLHVMLTVNRFPFTLPSQTVELGLWLGLIKLRSWVQTSAWSRPAQGPDRVYAAANAWMWTTAKVRVSLQG